MTNRLDAEELAGLRAAVAKQGREPLRMRRDLTDGIIATIDGLQADLDKATAELSQARERIGRLEVLSQDRLDVARELERERDEARASYAAGLEVQRDQLQRIEALTAELAALRAGAPDGWKLVPAQATPEMEAAFNRANPFAWAATDQDVSEMWKSMLAAAPQPPAQAKMTLAEFRTRVGTSPVFSDTDPEADWIEASKHACPHCGGSGHKDDVTPAQPVAVRVE